MGLNIPNAIADFARADAAKIVSDTLSKQLGGPGLSSSAMAQILIPLYGLTWNRHILGLVTTDRINILMQRLRCLQLQQSEYYLLSAFSQQAYTAAPRSPSGIP